MAPPVKFRWIHPGFSNAAQCGGLAHFARCRDQEGNLKTYSQSLGSGVVFGIPQACRLTTRKFSSWGGGVLESHKCSRGSEGESFEARLGGDADVIVELEGSTVAFNSKGLQHIDVIKKKLCVRQGEWSLWQRCDEIQAFFISASLFWPLGCVTCHLVGSLFLSSPRWALHPNSSEILVLMHTWFPSRTSRRQVLPSRALSFLPCVACQTKKEW